MWIWLLFDLPTHEPDLRKAYRDFMLAIKAKSFRRLQYSVYVLQCASSTIAHNQCRYVGGITPSKGDVICLLVTDKQHQQMMHVHDRRAVKRYGKGENLLFWEE